MNRNLVKQLLLSNNFWVLNKDIVKKYGLETAGFLSILAEAENLLSDKEGWFYQTCSTIEEMIGLTRYKQENCIKQLEEAGILTKEVRGMPARRYFKLNYNVMVGQFVNNQQTSSQETNKLYANNQQTSSQETNKLVVKKLATNKESTYKENNKQHSTIDDDNPLIDKGFRDVIKTFNENIHMITPYESERLESWLDDMDSEVIVKAIEQAIIYNKRSLGYIEGILRNWHKKGITNHVALENHMREWNERNKSEKDSHEGPLGVPKPDLSKLGKRSEEWDLSHWDDVTGEYIGPR